MTKTPVRLLIACAVALTALAVQSSALARPLDGLTKTWSAGVPTVARGLGAPAACPESNFPPGGLCGSVTVPLDRANPGAGTIDVGYALYPATDTTAPSVSTVVVSALRRAGPLGHVRQGRSALRLRGAPSTARLSLRRPARDRIVRARSTVRRSRIRAARCRSARPSPRALSNSGLPAISTRRPMSSRTSRRSERTWASRSSITTARRTAPRMRSPTRSAIRSTFARSCSPPPTCRSDEIRSTGSR